MVIGVHTAIPFIYLLNEKYIKMGYEYANIRRISSKVVIDSFVNSLNDRIFKIEKDVIINADHNLFMALV